MVNFGYPYNDIVICKDSTDYLWIHVHTLNLLKINAVQLFVNAMYRDVLKRSFHLQKLSILGHIAPIRKFIHLVPSSSYVIWSTFFTISAVTM